MPRLASVEPPHMSCVIRIERAVNGYEVEMTDPKIRAENMKPNTKWRDPEVSFVFKTVKEVTDFLVANLDKALPMDEYETSFTKALKEGDDD